MRKIFISTLEEQTGNTVLRLFFTDYLEKVSYIEKDIIQDNILYIVNYVDFLNGKHDSNLPKVKDNNGIILIRHDFSINVIALFEKIIFTIKTKLLNPSNICVQLSYFFEKKLLEQKLFESNIYDVKIFVFDQWMDKIYEVNQEQLPIIKKSIKNKFSAFSRRYDEPRFLLYLELLNKNLLSKFHYTFSNNHAEIKPYPYTFIEISKLIELANKKNYNNSITLQWINGFPYTDLSDFEDAYSQSIQNLLESSEINLILETEIYPDYYNNRDVTEKVYKPIIAKKPFFIFGTPDAGSVLQKEGFQTFSPYINEEYLNVVYKKDNQLYVTEKIQKLVDEITRLDSLSETDFKIVIDSCREIVEQNYNHFYFLIEEKRKSLQEMLKYLELETN